MAADDELPEDEEEILVYVEFDGLISDNAFGNEQLRLDMIGIDTDHPIMQINGRFYEGTYEDAVGTYMFFEKTEQIPKVDLVFDTPSNLAYVNKTRKILKMQRVFIENRAEVLGDSENSQCMPNLEIIQEAGVPLNYQEDALSFWNKLRDYRMDVLNSYLEKQKNREERKSKGIAVDSESEDDHPFATYRPEDQDEAIAETMNQVLAEVAESKRTENNVPMETESETHSNAGTNGHKAIDGTSKESETRNAASGNVHPSISTATESDTSTKKKACKKKLPTVATKKPKVVQSGTKKKLKKTFKSAKAVIQDENPPEIKQSSVEEKAEKCELKKQEGESSKTMQEQKMEVDKLTTTMNKNDKDKKREAKMQEILQRLEALASDSSTDNNVQ